LFEGRKEILEFKDKCGIPHDYDKIYIKVFNERKLSRARASKRLAELS
jgi:hypothetical protein